MHWWHIDFQIEIADAKESLVFRNFFNFFQEKFCRFFACDFSFVVKESLLRTAYMKDILNALGAIGVSRVNPREDLKTVLTEGKKVLQSGRSMIVFPQSTRTRNFDREQFNSIGIKLAKSAGVPVVPLALKTDLLESGRVIRDLGPLYPERDVRFEFGAAMDIEGNGQLQQQAVEDFIAAAFDR